MSNKNDRPENEFGHSPFNRDSYLSTYGQQVSKGADTTADQEDHQEDIDIMSTPVLSEQESEALQDELAASADNPPDDDSEPSTPGDQGSEDKEDE